MGFYGCSLLINCYAGFQNSSGKVAFHDTGVFTMYELVKRVEEPKLKQGPWNIPESAARQSEAMVDLKIGPLS
jgi:hypothetical protein